jgi:hypothetical protein
MKHIEVYFFPPPLHYCHGIRLCFSATVPIQGKEEGLVGGLCKDEEMKYRRPAMLMKQM